MDELADEVRRGDPDRWRAAMLAPAAVRPGLFALYAFNLEVARAPWLASEPALAAIRLAWWREALDEITTTGRRGGIRWSGSWRRRWRPATCRGGCSRA